MSGGSTIEINKIFTDNKHLQHTEGHLAEKVLVLILLSKLEGWAIVENIEIIKKVRKRDIESICTN